MSHEGSGGGRSPLGDCPVPTSRYDTVVMGHGSGGRLAGELLDTVFFSAFSSETLHRREDSAVCALPLPEGARLAFTTDAFVVRPLFFPGGDIGRLSIAGTVNDLAVSGATPRLVSAAFILEEGYPLAELRTIAQSMAATCHEAGVELVAGDTKVVDRGKGDGVFIATTGVGVVPAGRALSASALRPGDVVLVSGTLGDHGVAILSVREGLAFETELLSDCAPLGGLCAALLDACPSVRCMRDPTRGGLSSTLHELAEASRVAIRLDEDAIPLRAEVRAACEMLGLDPLYVANEGKVVVVVPPEHADAALAALRAHPLGRDAARVGEVVDGAPGHVSIRGVLGTLRLVPRIAGEQLPRIC